MENELIPITVAMAERIDTARQISQNSLSSHAFPSLFYWRKQMKLSLRCDDDWFAVKCGARGENTWFFPCGNTEKTKAFIAEKRSEKGFRLCYVSEKDKALLEEAFAGAFAFTRTPSDDEYLYDIEGQLALKGGKYANIRTQVHKMERDFSPTVKPLTAETVGDAAAVLEAWKNGSHPYDRTLLNDDGVDEEMLETLTECGIIGCVVYLNGVPSAVSAGFSLDGETFDMALSKTSENIQGLSYYSKREVMKQIYPQKKILNLEEDLGIDGLIAMKKSMNPTRWNKTWEATPDNESE